MAKRWGKSALADGTDPNRWMLTFSDMLTLLLTFFVLLFSMSCLDIGRLKAAFSFFGGVVGILDFSDRKDIEAATSFLNQIRNLPKGPGIPERVLKEKLFGIETRDPRQAMELLGEGISVKLRDKGVAITFEDRVMFDPGKAEIKEGCLPFLNRVAQVIRLSRYPISIEGHTDDIPIHTERFPSNWELSLARTLSILQYFIDQEGINPHRFKVAGYGDSKPLYPNDSEEHRTKNRRVEIILIT